MVTARSQKYKPAPNESHRWGEPRQLAARGGQWGSNAIPDMFSVGLFSIRISPIYTRLRPAAELESVFRPGQCTSYKS